MDLASWANVAEILGAATVVGGVLFAMMQIREFRAQRQEAAAFELVRSFQSPQMHRAFEILNDLPDGLTAEEIASRGREVHEAMTTVAFSCEALGVMVYHRVVPMRVLDEMMGAFIRAAWRKVAPYAAARRTVLGHNNYFEWFQWLAERLHEHPAPSKRDGAHVAHRSWRP